jgi:mono/diheme cytochrome c family protein
MDASGGIGRMLTTITKRSFGISLCRALCLALGFGAIEAQAKSTIQGDEKNGERIVQERCVSCHSVTTQDPKNHESILSASGPSLANSGDKFVPEWLEKWLAQPTQIWPAGYLSFRHVITTPEGDRIDASLLPGHVALPPSEAHEVTIYLLTLKKEPNQYPVSSAPSEIPGKLLFDKVMGCRSCHQAEPAQGGQSGPELYTAAERLRKEWVQEFIADPQYWGSGLMAKSNMGGTQLQAIVDYLFRPASATTIAHSLVSKVPSKENALGESQPLPHGKTLYLTFCSQCHGVQGNGKGLNAVSMSVAPRNHTSNEEMAGLTDERLFAAIKFGGAAVGKSSFMPSWAPLLTDADIDALVAYLHKLNGSETSAQAPPSSQPASFTELRSSR